MATKIDIDLTGIEGGMTPRELLKAAGFSVGAKGKFNKDMNAVLDVAREKGYAFATPAERVKVEPPPVSQKEIDPLEFNEWEVSKGYTVSERRWSNARINEFLAENPDFKRREKVVKSADSKTTATPFPEYDPKAVRAWAIENGRTVPARGRFSRELLQAYFDAGNSSTKPPVAEKVERTEPTAAEERMKMYGDTAPRVNMANAYEAVDLDGSVIKRSFKDCDVKTGYSIGWVPGKVFCFSKVDTDVELELSPVNV